MGIDHLARMTGEAGAEPLMVRTDRHHHRLVAAETSEVEALKVLARARRANSVVQGPPGQRLRSGLRKFYTATLLAFDDLTSTDALEVLRIAPTPVLGASLSRSKIAAAQRRSGRQQRVNQRTTEIQSGLRSEQLVTNELLDAVTDEMGVDAELPPGRIVHVHFEKDGRAHGVDVWDSVETYELFVHLTLMPAMGKVAVARGLDPSKMGEPKVTITEVHRLVR